MRNTECTWERGAAAAWERFRRIPRARRSAIGRAASAGVVARGGSRVECAAATDAHVHSKVCARFLGEIFFRKKKNLRKYERVLSQWIFKVDAISSPHFDCPLLCHLNNGPTTTVQKYGPATTPTRNPVYLGKRKKKRIAAFHLLFLFSILLFLRCRPCDDLVLSFLFIYILCFVF